MYSPWPDAAEWLETDGRGGFAMGTVSGIRTRRYHGLLVSAASPPKSPFVLVNGFDAWIEAAGGTTMISAQRYAPDVLAPDSSGRYVEFFEPEPWPRWVFRLPDGGRLIEELFMPQGAGAVVLIWSLEGNADGKRFVVRPFLSGRNYHDLHRENGAFAFDPTLDGALVTWRPYPGVPAIRAYSSGRYRHEPHWYRNFQYDRERERGLDFTEDLAAPGAFEFDLSSGKAVLIFSADGRVGDASTGDRDAVECAAALRAAEKDRRARFASRLHRAADAYVARGAGGKTVVAGYPWMPLRGRDTFIALRGLCIASGRLDDAGEILAEWSDKLSDGMLPSSHTNAGEPEFDSVDASLWYIIAAHDWLSAAKHSGRAGQNAVGRGIQAAILSIVEHYARGTRFGIRQTADGLLAAGEPGRALTWMDAKVGDWIVTPRIGKPVEVQALWINALRIAADLDDHWRSDYERAHASFEQRFWNESTGCLNDVVDVDHQCGTADSAVRPNQIFAVGGLPLQVLSGPRAERLVAIVERHLWTPNGLRTLAPGGPGYQPRFEGGPAERVARDHQGPVRAWLAAAFVEAWLRVRGNTPADRLEARARFLAPLREHLDDAGLGHVSELFDAESPYTPRGCPFQAWSVGELLRLDDVILGEPAQAASDARAARRGAPSESSQAEPVIATA